MFRNDLIELIQYAPQTETVFATPIVLSPPWINKYYVMDLAPGKSFAEWAITHGHTVFAISYRNPDESMRDLGMEDYMRNGLLAALEAVGEITGADEINIAALCLGGTLTSVLLAYLARPDVTGPKVRSATLLNTLVDFSEPGPLGHFVDETTVGRLEARMAKKGFLAGRPDGRHLQPPSRQRPDLALRLAGWLMGESPPAFDILAWNDDATRMPARMHSEYLHSMYLENRLATGRSRSAAGRSLSTPSTSEMYVLSAREDHITPWRGCYRTTHCRRAVRFVLTSAGHIAGIVNPPGPKRSHFINDELGADPDAWLAGATRCRDRGGRTGRSGSASAPVSSTSLPHSGATPTHRSRTRPEPTFSAERGLD